ncbi:WecB/TagA/CpsF family glycosyltransferase [Calothrix sp. PCC 6303]|uniref:WecB/TagA/CpsF family glycosyltransferase n=1 Tax=Calothrix sp. PCC 6303 TaxID=1170562 RepID=UPI0002A031E1|nr:WecB/TagA/CpsF family glycosyltransferase [Calothrix sp. PCC 6303]AFZ02574.1 glycosyl transferase, WecB/TagA/CpsF family [Calothrix sp. PCC 6303]
MRQINLLNVTIHNITMAELLESIRGGGVVLTPNVDHIMKLQNNVEFYGVYQEADYRVCDSKILMYVSNFLGTPIQEKISGSDLFPAFYNHFQNDQNIKIFLLGADQQTVKTAQQKINHKVGRDIVVAAHSPSFGFEQDEVECQKIVELINASKATVLAVGVGAPKQELWIAKYKSQLVHVKIFLAIGATINFEAGDVQRSPRWMSEIGLEWLFRLASEPRRLWKRYILSVAPFFWLVLQQKLSLYENPWSTIKPTNETKILPKFNRINLE